MASVFEVLARLKGRDEASPAVKKAEGSFRKFQSFLASKFVITLGDVTRAARSIIRAFTATIKAAGVQEEAIARLEARMKASGDFTEAASVQMQKFASELQKVTTIGDETALQMLTLAKSFGATNEQARNMVKVAADFAIAADLNIVEALRRMGRSFSGSVEDISKFAPEIKGLSKEALAAGEQIDILGKAVEGLAEASARTTAGGLTQLGNAFGDLQEAIGFGVTRNEDFNKSIQGMKKFIEENGQAIGDFVSSELAALVNGIKLLIGYYTTLGSLIGKVVVWFHNFDAAVEASGPPLEALERTANRLGITVDELRERLKDASHEIGNVDTTAQGAQASVDLFGDKAGEAADEVDRLGGESSKAKTALEELGAALGVVTSAELAREVDQITGALEKARLETGGNTREFLEYEEQASEKIESLKLRIQSLKDGMGDLKTETEETTQSAGEFNEALVGTRDTAREANTAFNAMGMTLQRTRQTVAITALEFDKLAISAGRAAVINASLQAGGTLGLGGTRLYLPGGGSRLVRPPGGSSLNLGFNVSGGVFTSVTPSRPVVGPGGRIETP